MLPTILKIFLLLKFIRSGKKFNLLSKSGDMCILAFFKKCPVCTHDDDNVKLGTIVETKTDYSVPSLDPPLFLPFFFKLTHPVRVQ